MKLSFKSEYSDGKCRFVCLGYSASYMHKIWTCCWCQLRMSCPGFDDNLLPNFLSHWKGKVLDGNFMLISLICVLKIFKFGWLLLLIIAWFSFCYVLKDEFSWFLETGKTVLSESLVGLHNLGMWRSICLFAGGFKFGW